MSNRFIIGGKGGGKGGSNGGNKATEAPNTLQARSHVRILDVISEGCINGLVAKPISNDPNPETSIYRSIYFDGVPLQNSDGSFNFRLSNKPYINNGLPWTETSSSDKDSEFLNIESEVRVNRQVLKDIPIIEQISNTEIDKLRLKIRFPVFVQSTANGSRIGTEVKFKFEINDLSNENDEYVPILGLDTDKVEGIITKKGKSTSAVVIDYLVEMLDSDNSPKYGEGPWLIRMSRITPDATDITTQNAIYFDSYTEIIAETKFAYPDTALIGISADAENFDNIPVRTYDVKGVQIKVPSNRVGDPNNEDNTSGRNESKNIYNYDNPIWDGTFKLEWSDNPAWILYDLLTHKRYGLRISPEKLDKWAFYKIGQYCDEQIPDGQGGMARRFTFNAVLNKAQGAYQLINSITGSLRSLLYWGSSIVTMIQDSPMDPIKLVAPDNVEQGLFHYTSTDIKSRHSNIRVTWNDPDDQYRLAVESIENPLFLRNYGFNPLDTFLIGCTNRAEAHRHAVRIRDEEIYGKEIVRYRAGWDHADVRPGQVIEIQDPVRTQIKASGRCSRLDATSNKFLIASNAIMKIKEDNEYVDDIFKIISDQGSVLNYYISEFDSTNSETFTLTISSTESDPSDSTDSVSTELSPVSDTSILDNLMFIIVSDNTSNNLEYGYNKTSVQYRILDVAETELGLYEVTAIFHDPLKFDRVENDFVLHQPLNVANIQSEIFPVANINIELNQTANQYSLFVDATPNTLSTNLPLQPTPPDSQGASGAQGEIELPPIEQASPIQQSAPPSFYRLAILDPNGEESITTWQQSPSWEAPVDIEGIPIGATYEVKVQTADRYLLRKSSWVTQSYNLDLATVTPVILTFTANSGETLTTLQWTVEDNNLTQEFEIYKGPFQTQLTPISTLPGNARSLTVPLEKATYWIRAITEHTESGFKFYRISLARNSLTLLNAVIEEPITDDTNRTLTELEIDSTNNLLQFITLTSEFELVATLSNASQSLASFRGKLFGGGFFSDFGEYNADTGDFTSIIAGGSHLITGLAGDNKLDKLFMVKVVGNGLFEINADTGAETFIGGNYTSLALTIDDDDNLFQLDNVGLVISILDKSNGDRNIVWTSPDSSVAFNSLFAVGNKLYSIDFTANILYEIDWRDNANGLIQINDTIGLDSVAFNPVGATRHGNAIYTINDNKLYKATLDLVSSPILEGSHTIATDLDAIVDGIIAVPEFGLTGIGDYATIQHWLPNLAAVESLNAPLPSGATAIYQARWRSSLEDTWTNWSHITSPTRFSARYIELQIIFTRESNDVNFGINLPASWEIDLPDRIYDGTGTSSGTSIPTQITFPQAYIRSPHIVCQMLSHSVGDYIADITKTKSNFTIKILDQNGNPIERNFDWVAKGV